MKKIFIAAFLLICMVLTYSCHKDSKVIPNDFYFKATKNTADWSAQGSSYAIPGDSIGLKAFKPAGEEQIAINIKFIGAGTYPLSINQAGFYTTVGLEVVTSNFILDTTQMSTVIIKSYDQANRIIAGSFELHLLNVTFGNANHSHLDFTNGLFRVKLPN